MYSTPVLRLAHPWAEEYVLEFLLKSWQRTTPAKWPEPNPYIARANFVMGRPFYFTPFYITA